MRAVGTPKHVTVAVRNHPGRVSRFSTYPARPAEHDGMSAVSNLKVAHQASQHRPVSKALGALKRIATAMPARLATLSAPGAAARPNMVA